MLILRVAIALLPLLGSAQAQERPIQGIGFAQAEEGTWLCRHEQPAEALSCARELCIEQASGQECYPTAWCFPANWAGLMVVWLGDFHTTQVLCGAPTEASLTEALRALCAGDEGATSCELFKVIDPEGIEREVTGVSFPGPAAPAEPEAGTAASAAEGEEAAGEAPEESSGP
jgi:hypothetical protein